MIAEDSVRFAHSGPSQRFLRGLRPLVSVGPLPLPESGGGHASAITTILPLKSGCEAKRVLNMELKDESDNVMTAEEMQSSPP